MNTKADTARLKTAWSWVLRLRDDDVAQEELAAWLAWYEADEGNKDAFEEMQSFWQQIDRVTEEPDPLTADLWLGALAEPRPAPAPRRGWWQWMAERFRSRRNGLLVLGTALAAGLAAMMLVRPLLPGFSELQTQAPVLPVLVSQNTLPDGSRVELAPKSSVAVEYSDKQRLLDMQGGEAYFTVAHNKSRPFIVKVGALCVRAVGTAFNVRSAGERVVVTVAEGAVDVYPTPQAGADLAEARNAVRIAAGNAVIWASNGTGLVVASVNPSYALAWRQGRLEYLNEPLDSAIADINRYSTRQIVIGDPAVGDIVFSGTVLATATDAWIEALPDLFPVDVQIGKGGSVLLVSRPEAAKPTVQKKKRP